MKSLTLLSFFIITISDSLSTPIVHHDHAGDATGIRRGFTVDLIHRDSPLSPLFNPTTSRSDRLRNAFLRSISQASRLSEMAGFTSKIEADVFGVPGEYIMQIQIGTPPVEVLGVADTGSDLSWAQCQPCKNCYKQVGPPFLNPSSSSSYQTLSCQSKACEALDDQDSSCNSKNICQYKIRYGDQSYTKGDLAIDTFWVGQTLLKNIVFGCGHDNNGTFNDNVSGIVGLGGGPLSLINQVNSLIQGKFSYCLIPELNYSNEISNQTSKIHFGDHVNISGPNVVSTPLVKKYPSTYYYLTLENVFVGNNNLSYTQSISNTGVEAGNIIIDSGTTMTILPKDLYNDLTTGLTNAMGGAITQGNLEVCYKDLNLDRVPKVTFQFTGADIELSPANMFWEMGNGVSCLAIVPTENLAIFGNLLQRNLMVGYDLVNQKVSFMPTDCTMQ